MRDLMEKVLETVAKSGSEGDLIFSKASALKLSAQKGALSEYKVSSSQILGLRLIKNGQVGISYTEALDHESLNLLVKQARENAETSEPNPHERLLDLTGTLEDSIPFPEEVEGIDEKTALSLYLETGMRKADSRVTSVPYNGFSENEFHSYYLSSKGRHTIFRDKTYSISSSALLEENGKKANFYHYDIAHRFSELRADHVIETALYHSRNILQEKVIPTGKYSVVFNPDMLKNLIECFSNFYSGKAAMDKMNPWADKIGTIVASKDLTITDHPHFERAFRASLFDSEGVERRPLDLVKDGVLTSLCHNSVTSSFFKTKTTGHGARGASSSLGVVGTEFVITGKNPKPLPSKYLEIIQMDGLYSGANRVTGRFSVAIKGYLWENGERISTVGNVTLSGNLLELLTTAQVTSEQILSSSDASFFSVPLVFHDLSIAGQG